MYYSPATVSAYGCAFGQFLNWRIARKYGENFKEKTGGRIGQVKFTNLTVGRYFLNHESPIRQCPRKIGSLELQKVAQKYQKSLN